MNTKVEMQEEAEAFLDKAGVQTVNNLVELLEQAWLSGRGGWPRPRPSRRGRRWTWTRRIGTT